MYTILIRDIDQAGNYIYSNMVAYTVDNDQQAISGMNLYKEEIQSSKGNHHEGQKFNYIQPCKKPMFIRSIALTV